MSEWVSKPLAEAGVAVLDCEHKTPAAQIDGFPYIAIPDVQDGRIVLSTARRISAMDLEAWTRRTRPQAGDIVVTRRARVGHSAPIPVGVQCAIGQNLVLLRSDGTEFDQKYLRWAVRSPAWWAEVDRLLNVGAVFSSLNVRDIARIRLPLPPLVEQRAIADVLGALDDKIAANTKLAATADECLAARLEPLMTGYSTVLETIAEVNASAVKPTPGGSLRYVDIASVGVGSFEYPELTPWDDAPGRARRRLRRGDTIWSTVRPNRRSHALNLSDDPSLVASTGLAVLSPRTVGFAYLYEVTRLPAFTAYLENVAEGSAYPAVRADRFRSAPIPTLGAETIAAFEAEAAPLREYVFALTEENRTLAATRDALLPHLMSGKLRVRDVEGAV